MKERQTRGSERERDEKESIFLPATWVQDTELEYSIDERKKKREEKKRIDIERNSERAFSRLPLGSRILI